MATYYKGAGTTQDPRKYYSDEAGTIELSPEQSKTVDFASAIPLKETAPITTTKAPRYPVDSTTGKTTTETQESPLQKARRELYGSLDTSQLTDEGKSKIREQVREDFEAYFDAINAKYAQLFKQEEGAAAQRSGRTRAISSARGLLDSSFGTQAEKTTEEFNIESRKALENQKLSEISVVSQNMENIAQKEIEAERARISGNADKYIKFLEESQSEARANIERLAKSGAMVSDISEKDYAQLLKSSGYDPLTFKSVWNSNLPESMRVQYQTSDTQLPNGNFGIVRYGYDPISKKPIAPETYDFGVSYQTVKGKYPGGYKEVDGILYGLQQDGSLTPLTKKQTSFSDMPSSYKEWNLAGGEKGTGKTYAEFVKQSSGGAVFKPTSDEKSAVNRYLSSLKEKGMAVTDEDFKKAESDSGFFYSLLDKAIKEKEFNIQPFKYPTSIY